MKATSFSNASKVAFAALIFAIISFTACSKMDRSGTAVEFSVSQVKSPLTKTAYGADGSGFQYIDWTSGDKVRIFCNQCFADKYSDYSVTNSGHSGNLGTGTVTCDNPLLWGEGSHTFYAVYPSPSMTGSHSNINGKVVTGTIPMSQGYGAITGTTAKVASPDMNNQYMVAKAEASPDAASVTLNLKPMTTALEFTIENAFTDTQSAMRISSITLSSDSYALNGDFSIDIDVLADASYPETTTTESGPLTKRVIISFETPVEVAYGNTFNFTFFLNPGSGSVSNGVNDITFTISGTNVGAGANFTRSAALKKDGVGVAFPTHKKTRITGLLIPESVEWDIEGDIVVTPWENGASGNIPLE